RVLLDTDGKNPTRMFGRVKPDLGAVEGRNPAQPRGSRGHCAAGLTRKCPCAGFMQKSPLRRPLRAPGFVPIEIFFQKSEHDPVHPLAVAEIRLPFDSFADETHALRVSNGAIVEAVALELK